MRAATWSRRTSGRSSKQGIRAVAARAGVSTASVSRALNSPDSVSAELRRASTEAVQSVGYIPHASARALSSRRTRTLGAIIPTIDNTMFARGIASLQKYLSSVGYMLLLTTSGYDLDAELEQARNLISRGVDGLVLRGDCHHDALRKMLADNAVPFINVGVYRPDRPYPCVGTDNEAAAYRAADACRRTRPSQDRDRLGAAAEQRSRQRARRRLSPRVVGEWNRTAAAMACRGALYARRCARGGALSAQTRRPADSAWSAATT